ncbi:MAG TPA: hypothetical protein VEN78_38025 [Bradyrhizobium sp.]|nr:hypothetical protein [Bradyrhizobium sp.]
MTGTPAWVEFEAEKLARPVGKMLRGIKMADVSARRRLESKPKPTQVLNVEILSLV